MATYCGSFVRSECGILTIYHCVYSVGMVLSQANQNQQIKTSKNMAQSPGSWKDDDNNGCLGIIVFILVILYFLGSS